MGKYSAHGVVLGIRFFWPSAEAVKRAQWMLLLHNALNAPFAWRREVTCPRSDSWWKAVLAAQTLLSDLKPWAPVIRSLLLLGPPSQASIHHTIIFWKKVILELSRKTRGTHSQNFTYPFSWSSSLVVFQPRWGNKLIPNKPKIIKRAEQKWVLHETMHVSWDRGWSCLFCFFSPWIQSQVWLHDFLGITIIMVQVTNTVHIWICLIFFTTWVLETKLMKANQSWPDRDAK